MKRRERMLGVCAYGGNGVAESENRSGRNSVARRYSTVSIRNAARTLGRGAWRGGRVGSRR
jgi:hypothetical protein